MHALRVPVKESVNNLSNFFGNISLSMLVKLVQMPPKSLGGYTSGVASHRFFT